MVISLGIFFGARSILKTRKVDEDELREKYGDSPTWDSKDEYMPEKQISSIVVKVEDTHKYGCHDEAYRRVTAEIVVCKDLDMHAQEIAVVHEVLGVFLGSTVPLETLEEIAGAIVDATDSL